MELPAYLVEPPPPAEPVATGEVSNVFELKADELTLSMDTRFIPERVGSPNGTTEVTLFGQFNADRQHPGGDYESCHLIPHNLMERKRLGRYRWVVSNVMLEPPCVTVAVDRVVCEPKAYVQALATGEQCTFWLSTLGVRDLEMENHTNPLGRIYQDYVEVQIYAEVVDTYSAPRAYFNARRCLHTYDNAYWEKRIDGGTPLKERAQLGDHTLELLEIVWLDTKGPLELHAQFRLTRGTTADNMQKSPPPPPFVPYNPNR